ncbi:MAG: Asp-tRNA(Asn)/Glu-tRNA(Gln) amidotransferase subunit GatA [Chitinophagaceae bacterium]|nr:Asp-tRNA(Asn)/Glu-tRNA(Gln) amidotransferase subunit GatA [Chitinophagaceae bacterium]
MFQFQNIKEYQSQLFTNKSSCHEAVLSYLQLINENKHLNAFVEVYAEESIQKAAELDAKRKTGIPPGKMHGVIVAIKDVICYKNHKVSAASEILKGFNSLYSATAIERLLSEDAIIIGNCNCDEFAMGSSNENSAYGPVLNALDETKVPGGSSGGSAVAVQAGLCMVSLGSDTGGSVRQPADFCGIIGFKPGYGTISRHGLIAYASSFDQIGIFGNTIEDISLVLEIIKGEDEYDSTICTIPQKNYEKKSTFKIACFTDALNHHSLDGEIKSEINGVIESLKNDGHTVEMVNFDLLDYVVPTYYVLTTAEASSNLSRYDGVRYGYRKIPGSAELTKFYTETRTSGFGDEVKRRIMLGTFVLSAGFYDAYFTKAQQVRRLLAEHTAKLFDDYNAMILPTVPATAFKIGDNSEDPVAVYLADIYTVYANLVGIPAISIPLFKHTNGLPFGLQIMTNKYNELPLLDIATTLIQKYKRY